MALTVTNAQISIQDGPGAPVNLTSGSSIGLFTPGAQVTFALQSTTGIARAEYQLICPAYPGLHQRTFTWFQGMVNGWQVIMPASTEVANASALAGILVQVTVTDSVSSIANSFNYLQSKGGNASEFQIGVDYVMVAALPAYTNVSGTLTGNANGAITSTMADGQTPAVGDTFLLPGGIAGALADAALYTITAVGAAGAKFVAVLAGAWSNGISVMPKTEILVTKGTTFGGTTWVVSNTAVAVIGTNAISFFPRTVTFAGSMTAGALAITKVPILNAVTSNILSQRLSFSGAASTVMYCLVAVPTPGNLGTATVTLTAVVAAGTINAADGSAMTVTITNQV